MPIIEGEKISRRELNKIQKEERKCRKLKKHCEPTGYRLNDEEHYAVFKDGEPICMCWKKVKDSYSTSNKNS